MPNFNHYLGQCVAEKISARQLASWLIPQEIVLDVELRDSRHALEWAAASIGRRHGLEPAPIFRALWRREVVGSTGLGHGVAIPHARIDGIERPLTTFARPKCAIEFAAPDGKPVSSILVIMVPANGETDDHLRLLALVGEMFSDASFQSQLLMANAIEKVQRAFANYALHIAAR
jgi:PTS system nitrogen regulatory IIA component